MLLVNRRGAFDLRSINRLVGFARAVRPAVTHTWLHIANVYGGWAASGEIDIMEAANDAIILADATGCIVSWNAAAARIFGHTAENVIGKPLTVIIPEKFRSAHDEGIRRVASGSTVRR